MGDDIKIKGIVKSVNKNGIFLLKEGELDAGWWNGLGAVTKFIKDDLKGKEVEITIINQEKKTFSFLKVLSDSKVENTMLKEAKEGLSRDRIIVRQNVLSHASNVIGKDTEEFFKFAEKCENWVFRNE